METRSVGLLAVVAIGSGMIILFLLAGITVAIDHPVPTEYWAAAGALSGAMVGLLAPPPATRGALTRQAARLMASWPDGGDRTPAPARERVAASVGTGGVPAPPQVDITDRAPAGAPAPARAEQLEALNRALASASAYDLRVIGLLATGVAAFVAGIWLALIVGDHVPGTAFDVAVSNASTALIALGSAAGGALVGLLAPTPGRTPTSVD